VKPFGETLRQAREAKGVALDTVARYTRISLHYLDALERTDLRALPGGPFNQGYIRSYAEVLGIDPGPLLESYSEEARRHGLGTPESQQKTIQELSKMVHRKATSKRRSAEALRGVVLAGLALAVIALGLWLAMTRSGSEVGSPREPEPTAETAPNEAESLAEAPREAPSAPSARESGSGLAVPSSGVGTSVVEHELVGRSDRFPGGSAVCFWTRVVGAGSGETLQHVWKREGQTVMVRKLRVGSANWRTYSRYTLPPGDSGRWAVEAQTADGRVLAREEFVTFVASPPSSPPLPEDRAPDGIDESVHQGGRQQVPRPAEGEPVEDPGDRREERVGEVGRLVIVQMRGSEDGGSQ
jgi:cytoskeletal protein RodZ